MWKCPATPTQPISLTGPASRCRGRVTMVSRPRIASASARTMSTPPARRRTMSDRVVVHLPPMPQPKDFGLDAQVKNDTPAAERYDNALESLGARRQRHRQADRLEEENRTTSSAVDQPVHLMQSSTSGGFVMFSRALVLTFSSAALVGLCQVATPVVTTVEAQSRPVNRIRFEEMDRNNDGVITRQEWNGSARSFEVHDWNNDGRLSGEEVRVGAQRNTNWETADHNPNRWERNLTLDAQRVHQSRSQSRRPADRQRVALRPRDVPPRRSQSRQRAHGRRVPRRRCRRPSRRQLRRSRSQQQRPRRAHRMVWRRQRVPLRSIATATAS